MLRLCLPAFIGIGLFPLMAHAADVSQFDRDIAPLLKRHCVKCHGPARQEGKLNLALASSIIRGGKTGATIIPHDAEASLIWQRVSADEMPPQTPLPADEKLLLKQWITAGAPGLKPDGKTADSDHWAFRKLPRTPTPTQSLDVKVLSGSRSIIDALIANDLSGDNLTLSAEADRVSLIRRVSFDLTGLPPDVQAIREFEADSHPDAYERMVDRYLASPHYGERLGKVWLDAAGYADSNGYFAADSDRPLAYRYRDYVIRAINADKPFFEFIREQIAGDELAGIKSRNGETAIASSLSPARIIELLEATHYLRCGQDGSGESDGNPDEVRVDRYTVLETAMQNVSTGLLGLTIQCAKCHDHKFEPLTQEDYYSFQAVLIPAFPPDHWVKPNDRFTYATLSGEFETWQSNVALAEAEFARLQTELSDWVKSNRPRGTILFADSFDGPPESLHDHWSNTAPGDDGPGGAVAVHVNSKEAPAAIMAGGRLELLEGGPAGDRWLSTSQAFDWTPDATGASIQVTFDLVENHIGESKPAERIGYFIALHDFNDSSDVAAGNILVDGHPTASTAVFLDYPGQDSKHVGDIGATGYSPGHNYGVRITNKGDGKYLLEHLVDWQAEDKTITFSEADLPRGGFGFEFCCGRSFVVDNVSVESFASSESDGPIAGFQLQLKSRRAPLEEARKRKAALESSRPGKIAWTTDVVETPPPVHILLRGNYNSPGAAVEPAGYAFLNGTLNLISPDSGRTANPADDSASSVPAGPPPSRSSRRRLAFANWITQPDSSQSDLMARVHVNRLWQHHFGIGIVATPDNFGLSGSAPSHRELLDWLAGEFITHGGSAKHVARQIVTSAAYRQQSSTDELRLQHDPDSRRLSRFPLRRLDAEAIRDAMLAASGDLDDRMFGPYIATSRTSTGETVIAEDQPGSRRRSIYLQQKRTQVHSLLQVFDAPSIVFNSTRRPRSTMPLQSLSLLNSDFSIARAKSLAARLQQDFASDSERLDNLFLITTSRAATGDEINSITRFLQSQAKDYGDQPDAVSRAWTDLSQSLLIGNAALYLD